MWWLMPVIQALWRPRWVNHLRSGVQDQPDQHGETPSLKTYIKIKNKKKKENQETANWNQRKMTRKIKYPRRCIYMLMA